MAAALKPAEIFERAADEGQRRLDQSLLELIATAFIAGFTIIFGMIAMGIIDALARPSLGEMAKVLAALGFGVGIVFLVIGRAELFSENFLDPMAAAFRPGEKQIAGKLARLWSLTLILNVLGGAVLIAVVSVEGTLPEEPRARLIGSPRRSLIGRGFRHSCGRSSAERWSRCFRSS